MSISRKSVIASLLWKFLERCSVQVVSFVVTIVLARILCPEDYGLIALVMVFINISSVLVEGGLNTALIQKKNASQIDFSTIFYTSLSMALFLYLVLYWGAPFIAKFYGKEQLIPIVRLLGFSLFFYAINSVQKAYLIKNLLFKNLFFSGFGAVLLSGVLGVYMAKSGFGVWALVTQSVVSQIATTLVMWFTVKWRPTWEFSWDSFRQLFGFGSKILFTNFMISFFVNIRNLIIGKVYSAASLAYFDRGKQFPSLIIDNIKSSIQSVLFPVLADQQNSKSSVKQIVRRSIKTSTYIIFPLVIGLAVSADPLVRFLLTDKWVGAIPFIQIFCMMYLLMPMQIANMEAIKALGHSGTSLKLETIKKIIELLILIITVPIGVYAIAWGLVVYNLFSIFINTYPNKKLLEYDLSSQIKDVIPALLVSLAMGIIIILFNQLEIASWMKFVADVIIGIVVYLFLSIVFKLDAFMYLKGLFLKK